MEWDQVLQSVESKSLNGGSGAEVAPDSVFPDETDGALVEATLQHGFQRLRFKPELERRYVRDSRPRRVRTLLLAGALVVIGYNLMLIADSLMVPDMFDKALTWRLFLFSPLSLAGMWVIHATPSAFWRETWVMFMALLALGIQWQLISGSQSPLAAPYVCSLSLIMLYVNVLVRPQFWVSLAYSILIVGLSLLGFWNLAGASWTLYLPLQMVMLTTGPFTLYYLHGLEHEERHNYLLGLRQRVLKKQWLQANEHLARLSRFDALTQLANRRHVDDFLDQLWRAGQVEGAQIACIMVDVDHFKAFNDHFGHPDGDACLVALAGALQEGLRRPGDMVARYGGEEFVAVLNRTTALEARDVAERIRQSVQALHRPHPQAPLGVVTVSVGVASLKCDDEGATPGNLVALADEALYEAKQRGRNQVWAAAPTSGKAS